MGKESREMFTLIFNKLENMDGRLYTIVTYLTTVDNRLDIIKNKQDRISNKLEDLRSDVKIRHLQNSSYQGLSCTIWKRHVSRSPKM